MKINKYIDHTCLKPDAITSDIEKLCNEAIEYNFASVCVAPSWVKYASEKLLKSDVKVCSVIGFPLGNQTTETKGFETKNAIKNGADEIDMVINIDYLKENKNEEFIADIKEVVKNASSRTVKVIIETCLLTKEEKIRACELILISGADFVKTSTGFSTAGADPKDIELFRSIVKNNLFIKASGGIKNMNDAKLMIEKGADRLGTSGGVQIMNNINNNSKY